MKSLGMFLVAASLVGCSGGGPAGPIAASSYCESTAELFCEFYLRCGRMAVPDTASCRTAFAESCEGRYEERFVELETAGLITLSREGIESCRQHLSTVVCERQVLELAGPCGGMWEGLQPEGAACSYDVESFVCEPGTECVVGLTLCGICRSKAEVGEGCGPDVATCGSTGRCVDGSCVARVLIGESCTPEDTCQLAAQCIEGVCRGPTFVTEGDACDASNRCPYRTECRAGTCQATALLGEVCSEDLDCDTGFCQDSVCVALKRTGDACERSTQCAGAVCDEGQCLGYPRACITGTP